MRTNQKASLQFRLAKTNIIYARVYKNGVRSKDFSTGLKVSAEAYRDRNKEGELKKELDKLREKLSELQQQHPESDSETLKKLLMQHGEVTVGQAVAEYLKRREKDISLSSESKRTYRLRSASLFRLAPGLEKKPINQLEERTAERLVERHNDSYNRNYLLKLIQFLKQATSYAHQKGYTKRNMLEYFRFNFDKPKIVFLTENQLETLEMHCFASENLAVVRDLFLFQCWTGLAYSDLQTFKPEMIRAIRDRAYISGDRNKTGVSFTAPVPEKAMALLKKWEGKPPTRSNQYYNRMLKEIAAITGINLNLTTHIARKTAGMRWLNMGYLMEAVSRMLGHSKVATTQQWYAKVLPDRVIRETEEIERKGMQR